MGQYFELVIFTDEPSAYAIPVINKLDKHQASMGTVWAKVWANAVVICLEGVHGGGRCRRS